MAGRIPSRGSSRITLEPLVRLLPPLALAAEDDEYADSHGPRASTTTAKGDQDRPIRQPSAVLHEQKLSIVERFASAKPTSSKHIQIIGLVHSFHATLQDTHVPFDRPLFDPIPAEVVLQSFELLHTYEVEIRFRNADRHARSIKLDPLEARCFRLGGRKSKSLNASAIAPGMEASFVVIFTPEEDRDYHANLVCTTDRECFVLPIHAIGSRGLLDLPDQIDIHPSFVRKPSFTQLFVRNIGKKECEFQLSIAPPFFVKPKQTHLEVDECVQIDIGLDALSPGLYEADLIVDYEYGEIVSILVNGRADEADVRLEAKSLIMDQTYINLSSSGMETIVNKTDVPVRFRWKALSAESTDKVHRNQAILQLQQAHQTLLQAAAHNSEPTDLSVLSQRLKNQTRHIQQSQLLFNHDSFSIEPTEGTLWPQSKMDVTITFHPRTAGSHSCIAFCEVDGRENRLPLLLEGTGLGPKTRFVTCDVIDVEDILIHTTHSYEVIMRNEGFIDASFKLQSCDVTHTTAFEFIPREGVLKVGAELAIIVIVKPKDRGEFNIESIWDIQGALIPLSLGVKGRVVGPNIMFDVGALEFGDVPCGFSVSLPLKLTNSSAISAKYRMRIIDSHDNAIFTDVLSVEPAEGILEPNQSADFDVTFTPKDIVAMDLKLVVDMEDIGIAYITLPMVAAGIVPHIRIEHPTIELGRCFVGHEYISTVNILNTSNYHGKYKILPASLKTEEWEYTTESWEGVLEASSTTTITVKCKVHEQGQFDIRIPMYISGYERERCIIHCRGFGRGAKVVLSESTLDWGVIPVLTHVAKRLTMKNESPIPAKFDITFGRGSSFQTDNMSNVIPPMSSASVEVVAHLVDFVKKIDVIHMDVMGETHSVKLIARGEGTTVIFDEALKSISFGYIFATAASTREVELRNEGSRAYNLRWTVSETSGRPQIENTTIFDIQPSRFILEPHCSQKFVIRAFSSRPTSASAVLVCQGTVEKDPTRRQIADSKVSATFVEPLLVASPTLLSFAISHAREDDPEYCIQDIMFTNRTPLAVHPIYALTAPFSQYTSTIPSDAAINPGQSAILSVMYNLLSNNPNNRLCRVDRSVLTVSYAEHPRKETIQLEATATFPNLSFKPNIVDFGQVLIFKEQRKSFTIFNTSVLPAHYSWSIFNGEHATMFDLQPLHGRLLSRASQIVDVSILPTCEGVIKSCLVCDVVGGPSYTFPIIAGSCSSMAELKPEVVSKADWKVASTEQAVKDLASDTPTIIVPNLEFSMTNLEFGTVYCGQRKSIFLRVTNTSTLTGGWAGVKIPQLKKTSWGQEPRKPALGTFEIAPAAQVLNPGESTILTAKFSPQDDQACSQIQHIQLMNGAKQVRITMSGKGQNVIPVFNPAPLVFHPTLPCTELELSVKVTNPTPMPIELYSLEYDQQYLDEEEFLRTSGHAEKANVYCLPLREPGLPLKLSESVVEPMKELRLINVIVVHGPPYSGRSTQAVKLAELYKYQLLRFDDFTPCSVTTARRASVLLHVDNAKDNMGVGFNGSNPMQPIFHSAAQSDHGSRLEVASLPPMDEPGFLELTKNRLLKEDCTNGVIVDGLECGNVVGTPLACMRALMKLIPEGRRIVVVHLQASPQLIREREAMVKKQLEHKRLEQEVLADVPEYIYENLSLAEQAKIDKDVIAQRKRRKELLHHQKAERKKEDEHANEKRQEDKNRGGRRVGTGRNDKNSGGKAEGKLQIGRGQPDRPTTPPKQAGRHPLQKADTLAAEVGDAPAGLKAADGLANADGFLFDRSTRALELYKTTVDSLVALIKEAIQPVQPTPLVADKKPSANTTAGRPQTAQTAVPIVVPLEGDADGPSLVYREIDTNTDSDLVSDLVKAAIPVAPPQESTKEDAPPLPSPLLQTLYRVSERGEVRLSKQFSVLPLSGLLGDVLRDHEPDSVAESVPVPAPTPVAPAQSVSTGKGAKGRSVVKTAADEAIKPPEIEEDAAAKEATVRKYRWVIAANESKEIIVRFSPYEDVGIFNHEFGFGVVGYPGIHTLPVSGQAQYPHISSDVSGVFPVRIKPSKKDVNKPLGFNFGPVLYGKTKDADKFAENHTIFKLENISTFIVHADLCWRNDVRSDIFSMFTGSAAGKTQHEALSVELAPGQVEPIHISAYPRIAGIFEDSLVVNVKDNPRPFVFGLSVAGVKPEIEVTSKVLSFERILLGRKERREMKFRNVTALPASWKLLGVEALGEELRLSPLDGVVAPGKEAVIISEFHSKRPITLKRLLKLEVSDKTGSVTQTESLSVIAEAYDVSVELHTPKPGAIEFGVLKVFDDARATCSLRNRGKYEIGFRFVFEDKTLPSLITISPMEGVLQPSDKFTPAFVAFKSSSEVTISDSIIKCHYFELNTNEVMCTYPIKVTAKSVFSKFTISPPNELAFGPLIHGAGKVSKQLVIENMGEFDFRFALSRLETYPTKDGRTASVLAAFPLPHQPSVSTVDLKATGKGQKGVKNALKAPTERPNSPPTQPLVAVAPTRNVTRKDAGKQTESLTAAAFRVFPSNGTIVPGNKQIVSVEFHPEVFGVYDEALGIDISDRSPDESDPLEFRLLGETCVPGIAAEPSTILEGYSVIPRLDPSFCTFPHYALDEKVLTFGPTLLQASTVKLKFVNPGKVSCDITVNVKTLQKPTRATKNDMLDMVFDVDSKKFTLASYETKQVTLTFAPAATQTYSASLEVLLDGTPDQKNAVWSCELRGEGAIPRITLEKPLPMNTTQAKANGKAAPNQPTTQMKFRRLFIGNTQAIPVVLKNPGSINAVVQFELVDGSDSSIAVTDFDLRGCQKQEVIRCGQSLSVDVVCRPVNQGKLAASLRIKLLDSEMDPIIIALAGEVAKDDVMLCMNDLPPGLDDENPVVLGRIPTNQPHLSSITATNYSSDVVRVAFAPTATNITFSPPTFHLAAGREKKVTMSLTLLETGDFTQTIVYKVNRIRYSGGSDAAEVSSEWDSDKSIVRWMRSEGGPLRVVEPHPEPKFENLLQNDKVVVITASGAPAPT
ncbi:hypothetical protein SeMB42_g02815 [Synchytrium endobioticum]|uniref:MSP domain-containing protein n=1 Tax=Synchytrium endobioticum TaxID=286115 RepID=A0A507DDD8_9FUNG|nr:hypothetical protein SeMB42_g02815 [Synchytrium endobioticum]TPX50555.1 hypothetical protein SeLEV6574_g00846 [Synchytrium endobioticum]